MTILETIIFVVNEIIGRDYLGAVDAGDTIFVHLFGAYFGLTVARVLYNPEHDRSSKMGASYTSDMFSMVNIMSISCPVTRCCQGWDSVPLDVLAELQWRCCGQWGRSAEGHHQHLLLPVLLHHRHHHHQLPGVRQQEDEHGASSERHFGRGRGCGGVC